MKNIARCTMLLTTICLLWAAALSAEEGMVPPFPNNAGPEKWIDGPDAVQPNGDPRMSDVAVDNEGRRIHVWAGFGGVDRLDVYLRRFDTAGNPLEDPRRVNTTVAGEQQYPRVAVSADGSFLVIFQSSETPQGETFNQWMVRSQAYDADGNEEASGEQLVSTAPTKEQVSVFADVAALRTSDGSAGGYKVVWRNSELVGSNWGDIKGSIVSTAGVPGPESLVNSTINGTERIPRVTELPDGGYLVVWLNGPVTGRRFNSAGGPLGPDFQISTLPTGNPTSNLDIAIGWDERVLVVWEDAGTENPPLPVAQGPEIRGRMFQFDSSGNDLDALGDDFRINDFFTARQDEPRIADFGPVGFLVIWGSLAGATGPDMNQSVEARIVSGNNAFDADGDGADDNQVQFNVWDNNSGQNLLAAGGWYGRLATSWQSVTWDGEPEPDTINQNVITGRDIEHCMFCDDFEWFSPASTGSLWRWTRVEGGAP